MEYLDTSKAMPQLIRPQDLANVVQSLFYQLSTSERRLSRVDFVSKMEAFTSGHGFVQTTDRANKKIEKLNSIENAVVDPSIDPAFISNGAASFMSRESFSSVPSSNRALTESIIRANSSSSTKSQVVPPSSFPINMMLTSSDSFGGRFRETPVLEHASVEARSKRCQSSDRRMAAEQIGENKASLSPKFPRIMCFYELHFLVYGMLLCTAVNRNRSSSAGRIRPKESSSDNNATFEPHLEAAKRTAKLAYRGQHGERRRLGLSVGSGLHSCEFVIDNFLQFSPFSCMNDTFAQATSYIAKGVNSELKNNCWNPRRSAHLRQIYQARSRTCVTTFEALVQLIKYKILLTIN